MSVLAEKMHRWTNPFDAYHDEGGSVSLPNQLRCALEDLEAMFSGLPVSDGLPEFDRGQVYASVTARYADRQSLEGIKIRELKCLPWVMFDEDYPDPETGNGPIAMNRGILDAYLHEVGQRFSCSIRTAFVQVLLYFYPKDLPIYDFLVDQSGRLLAGSESLRCRKYARILDEYRLLETGGPGRYWKSLAESRGKVDSLLEDTGFTGIMFNSRFMYDIFTAGLTDISDTLKASRDAELILHRLFDLIETDAGGGKNGGLFKEHRKKIAESLLLPAFHAGYSVEEQAYIQKKILEYFGDPRLNRKNWSGISPKAEGVMRSWMTRATLEMFFEILQRLAHNITLEHWTARKAFWTAYLNREVIDDAWVVMSSELIDRAKRFKGFERSGVGMHSGYGRTADHAALLLKIGPLHIVEWNHNGACHLVASNSNYAPEFYKASYDSQSLSDYPAVIEGTGIQSRYTHQGNWQSRFADAIHQMTGIRITVQ